MLIVVQRLCTCTAVIGRLGRWCKLRWHIVAQLGSSKLVISTCVANSHSAHTCKAWVLYPVGCTRNLPHRVLPTSSPLWVAVIDPREWCLMDFHINKSVSKDLEVHWPLFEVRTLARSIRGSLDEMSARLSFCVKRQGFCFLFISSYFAIWERYRPIFHKAGLVSPLQKFPCGRSLVFQRKSWSA